MAHALSHASTRPTNMQSSSSTKISFVLSYRNLVKPLALGAVAWVLLSSSVANAEPIYTRIGIGASLTTDGIFMDRDCESESPIALYGCGMDETGAPRRTKGEFASALAYEFGLGYTLGSATRLEVLFDYQPRSEFSGDANFLALHRQQSVVAHLASISGIGAIFRDIDGPSVGKLGELEFSVGAGVGLARNAISQTLMSFPATQTEVPGDVSIDVAIMVGAGIGLKLNDRSTLELSWRYMDRGEVQTAEGIGRVYFRSQKRLPIVLDLAETQSEVAKHSLRISIRRTLGNGRDD